MSFTHSLIHSLYQIGAVQFGEFQLKSGQTSPIYINLRKIISYPPLLRQVAACLWEKISPCQFDFICGVPYTALPIATSLSLDHHLPMIMRRKEKKDHGTKQMIEGCFAPGQSCLIIEDIITSGASIMETAHDVEQAGLHVVDVAALIDREQGGKAHLAKTYRVHTVLSLTHILQALAESNLLKMHERQIVDAFI